MKQMIWGLMLAALLATSGSAVAREYDRYGLYGVGHPAGAHLLNNPPGYDEMVWRRIAEAGGTSSRQAASWREIEAVKGKYDWSQLEGTLQYCRKYPQIRPYILVVNTPGWAREDGQPTHFAPMESAIPDWKKFCTELAKQYKGYVRHYEIWNEQNGFGWEMPYNQFDKYMPIFKAAYEGLKEGDPDCIVSMGGLCNAAGNSPIFTKGVYDLRFKEYSGNVTWDAFGDHPYGDTKSMIQKLRAIKGIAAGYGDGDVELWLTEYGFHAGDMTDEEQAKHLTEYMTTLIMDPEFRYVTETNYLCVADFEDMARSFGLCDANLRPRAAFYAYQRLPRPGQIVISDIRYAHVSPASVTLTWQTDTDTSSSIEMLTGSGEVDKRISSSTTGKAHSVTLTGLKPGTAYRYMIHAQADGFPEARSLDYGFTTLAANGLLNPGFEEGFIVEIARHWECLGASLCFDSSRLEGKFRTSHSGKSAQAIVANGSWGVRLNDAVLTQASAEVGKSYTFSAWTCAVSGAENGAVIRRVGIDPTGGKDPGSPNIIWSNPGSTMSEWEKQTVSVAARNGVITLFAHAETKNSHKEKDCFYVDDASLTSD